VTGKHSVAFRVDAGAAIGIGHLRRCLTLAAELREVGYKVRFVCRDRLGPELELLADQYSVRWLENIHRDADLFDEEMWDADATLSVIGYRPAATSWVVVDHYRLGHRWESRVRDAGHRIIAIDDYRDRKHHADLLVSDSTMPFDPALNELGGSARVLVGREYALVDPIYAFSGLAVSAVANPKRLLVSYGGSDLTGETLKALEAIQALKIDDQLRGLVGPVDIVIGPTNPRADAIEHAAQAIQDIIVHKAPSSLEPLMRQADVILTGGGNTMVEAVTLRKPCIVTVTGDNQALLVSELHAEGVIRSLGGHPTIKPDNVRKITAGVLADFDTFAARIASRSLFDHLGAYRIASTILAWPASAL
jgi:UDP-2,4-diacetamido-2,4,6-trideoxy-beta-L-altropyranose hydrolase